MITTGLWLNRIKSLPTATVGKLYFNGKYICDTLEDRDRLLDDNQPLKHILTVKKWGATAIPYGVYNVSLTKSTRFKRILPEITPVKGFSGIRFHTGNSSKDTEGCILIGNAGQFNKDWISQSKAAWNKAIKMASDFFGFPLKKTGIDFVISEVSKGTVTTITITSSYD